MSAALGPFRRRFAHPRLAAAVAVGLALIVVGALLWLAERRVAGFRVAIVGFIVAWGAGAGYVSVSVFELRDRQLE